MEILITCLVTIFCAICWVGIIFGGGGTVREEKDGVRRRMENEGDLRGAVRESVFADYTRYYNLDSHIRSLTPYTKLPLIMYTAL